jgi:hypothetical protein
MTHQIDDIPDAEMTARFGQKESPNACLVCHTDKDIAWLRQELNKWCKDNGRTLPSSGARYTAQ